jgi:phosphate transport system protein
MTESGASRPPHFEESMQHDIERIKAAVGGMASLVERSLRDAVEAFLVQDRRLAFSVILRDRFIDEREEDLNRLCLEFLIRQQPAGGPLRMAYAAIRISLELERMGDYAESIARQTLRLAESPAAATRGRFREMAEMTVGMLRDAVTAFTTEDTDLAARTIEVESTVDGMKADLARNLLALADELAWSFESLNPWLHVSRRLERASDQARNICHEVIYMCTGRPTRHQSESTVRILFVDDTHGSLSRMAHAIGERIGKPAVVFASAGLNPQRLDAATIEFMRDKGMDVSRSPARGIFEVPDIEKFQVVVALSDHVKQALSQEVRGRVFLEWRHPAPVTAGAPEAVAQAHEDAYRRLETDVTDLLAIVDGE